MSSCSLGGTGNEPGCQFPFLQSALGSAACRSGRLPVPPALDKARARHRFTFIESPLPHLESEPSRQPPLLALMRRLDDLLVASRPDLVLDLSLEFRHGRSAPHAFADPSSEGQWADQWSTPRRDLLRRDKPSDGQVSRRNRTTQGAGGAEPRPGIRAGHRSRRRVTEAGS